MRNKRQCSAADIGLGARLGPFRFAWVFFLPYLSGFVAPRPMARTAADRPSASQQHQFSSPTDKTTTPAGGQPAGPNRKRPSTSTPRDMAKNSRMDVDISPSAGSRPKLSKSNQELFDLLSTYMDDKFEDLAGRVDNIRGDVAQNSVAIGELRDGVDRNRDEIEKIQGQIKDIKKKSTHVQDDTKIERMIDRALEKRNGAFPDVSDEVRKITEDIRDLKKAGTGNSGRTDEASSDETTQYWFARRGVRCWPVEGISKAELLASVGDFFEKKLRIPATNLKEDDIAEIRRIMPKANRFGKNSERSEQYIKQEVLVVLKEVQVRDMIFRHASNLATWREGKHPNCVGIRLHVPTHLLGKFNTYNQYGFDLRAKYGPGLKRYVRFDDSEMDLTMSVRLPSEDEWMQVEYQQALKETRINKKRRTTQSRGRLSSLQVSGPVNRADCAESAPLSAPPLQSTGSGRADLTNIGRDDSGAFRWGRNS